MGNVGSIRSSLINCSVKLEGTVINLNTQSIPALLPHKGGHQFVFYGDCCSGLPGGIHEKNFSKVNAVLQRMNPMPEFIVFLGDHIRGGTSDPDTLYDQWTYWNETEMNWVLSLGIPIHHVTSNHDTCDEISERIWCEVFSDIPHNGPSGQKGLSYWVRRNDLLLVVVNTCFSGLGGYGHVEHSWLDSVLSKQHDALHKIVIGHHPVFSVNGYDERPLWCIAKDEADAFWSVLVRHRVLAYVCSHIIAFDLQEHQGILQICSGGAGTQSGPGGFMGEGEYLHFVQASLDADEFHLQTVDVKGRIRDRFARNLATY